MQRIALTLLIVLALCSYAHANGYVGIYGGGAFYEKAEVSGEGGSSDIDFDGMGYTASLAFGLDFNQNFRGEIEAGYQKCSIDTLSVPGYSPIKLDGDVSITSFVANVYFDFLPHGSFSPFVFAGAGMAIVDVSNLDIEDTGYFLIADDDTVPAYNLGAGLSAPVGGNATVEFKYRYFGMSEPEINGAEVDLVTHSVTVGGKILF